MKLHSSLLGGHAQLEEIKAKQSALMSKVAMELTVQKTNQIMLGLKVADQVAAFEAALKMKWWSKWGWFNFTTEIGLSGSMPFIDFSKQHTSSKDHGASGTIFINISPPQW